MPAPAALIELWERGAACGALERGLLLLGVAAPELAPEALAEVDLPTRDARVFALRTALFGARFCGIADCPACAAPLEFACDGDALRPDVLAADDVGFGLRLPNSRDLALALRDGADEGATARALLRRCSETDDDAWDEPRLAAAEAALDAALERSGVRLALACAECGARWRSPLDICAWAWSELDRHVRGLLDDVHRLALCYGWSEAAILALHPVRRAAYLARCDA